MKPSAKRSFQSSVGIIGWSILEEGLEKGLPDAQSVLWWSWVPERTQSRFRVGCLLAFKEVGIKIGPTGISYIRNRHKL